MTDKPTAVVVRLHDGKLSDQKIAALNDQSMTSLESLLAIGTPVADREFKIWGNVSRENAKDLGPEQAVLMFGGSDTGPDDINLVDAEDAQAALAAAQAEIVRLRLGLEKMLYEIPAPAKSDKVGIACQKIATEALKGPEA